MITEEAAFAALDEVIHPSFGLSLVALGMVRTVRASASQVTVELVMNCPGCPSAEVALGGAWHALRALAPDCTVHLALLPEVWHAPWERSCVGK